MIEGDFPEGIDESTKLRVIEMLQPRVEFLSDFKTQSSYFWVAPQVYDDKPLKKKYKSENNAAFASIIELIKSSESTSESLAKTVKGYITDNELKFGAILPVLRIWITGSMAGPDLFEMMALLGIDESVARLKQGYNYCSNLTE
jgi:glutamyl-tRNA synthetase